MGMAVPGFEIPVEIDMGRLGVALFEMVSGNSLGVAAIAWKGGG